MSKKKILVKQLNQKTEYKKRQEFLSPTQLKDLKQDLALKKKSI